MVVRKSVFTAGGYAVGERGRRAVEDHDFYDVCIIHSNSHGKLFYNHLHRKDIYM